MPLPDLELDWPGAQFTLRSAKAGKLPCRRKRASSSAWIIRLRFQARWLPLEQQTTAGKDRHGLLAFFLSALRHFFLSILCLAFLLRKAKRKRFSKGHAVTCCLAARLLLTGRTPLY